ncbi:hypothetical protein S245_031785 [Arachis hypogaea]
MLTHTDCSLSLTVSHSCTLLSQSQSLLSFNRCFRLDVRRCLTPSRSRVSQRCLGTVDLSSRIILSAMVLYHFQLCSIVLNLLASALVELFSGRILLKEFSDNVTLEAANDSSTNNVTPNDKLLEEEIINKLNDIKLA